jgi:hypothetical protein
MDPSTRTPFYGLDFKVVFNGAGPSIFPTIQWERAVKVRCVRLLDYTGRPVEHSGSAKLDGVYHVLSIFVAERTGLRLVAEEPTPAVFNPEMFEVISAVIPPSWVATFPKPGFLRLAPNAWSAEGFWDRFFDGDPEAVAAFNEERAKIVAADP